MELSLIPNQKRLTFYIERLIYGVVIAMPLQPMVGDVLLWLAIGLALYDLISSKSLSSLFGSNERVNLDDRSCLRIIASER